MKFSTILITGGAGFVGSNLATYLRKKHPDCTIICLDNLKRRGSEFNLIRLEKLGIETIHGDIRCPDDLETVGDFEVMIECSAEPSVLAGYTLPNYMINTNLGGLINCLELCRRRQASLFFISTSRVYSIEALCQIETQETDTRLVPSTTQVVNGITGMGINEDFPTTGPRSLYGAAKLCGEILAEEYCAAMGVPVAINRCSILTGPWQMGKADQGVMAFWLLRHHFNRPLSYIGFGGSGKQVRDLLDIDDYCRLVDLQLKNFDSISGKTFNVGGGISHSLSLRELTDLAVNISGNRVPIGQEPVTRKGDIPYFVSDAEKISELLGWKPEISVEETMERIYRWITDNEDFASRLL